MTLTVGLGVMRGSVEAWVVSWWRKGAPQKAGGTVDNAYIPGSKCKPGVEIPGTWERTAFRFQEQKTIVPMNLDKLCRRPSFLLYVPPPAPLVWRISRLGNASQGVCYLITGLCYLIAGPLLSEFFPPRISKFRKFA